MPRHKAKTLLQKNMTEHITPQGDPVMTSNEMMRNMPTGTVKWFRAKGYGFIEPDDGSADVFVHISAVEEAGLSILTEGQKVEYEVVSQPDGRTAAGNLKLAD